jgi:hypothetical protein
MPPDDLDAAKTLVQCQARKRMPGRARRLRKALIGQLLRDQVREVFLDILSAQNLHSTVVSGSRADLLCVKAVERQIPDLSSIDCWEQEREVRIPWVSDLTPREVVAVREQAASALPRFRERFAQRITGRLESDAGVEVIRELRAEAAEVEAELSALSPRLRRRDRGSIGLLSIGVALYGVAALGVPATAGVAQLLATLGLIHGMARSDRGEEARIKTRPGYVLLKARELLHERNHG